MNKIQADTIAEKDLIGREKFSNYISDTLCSDLTQFDEGITFGICGPWGSGKSTLISYIISNITNRNNEQFKLIKYNSWANLSHDEIERNFIETILREIDSINWKTKLKKADSTLKDYLKYLNALKFLKYAHPIAANIIDGASDYINKQPTQSISDVKEKVNALIKKNSTKLFVFIDDLDRSSPDEIITIFKTIKLNLNLYNTYYVLAYDKEVVLTCLEKEFGKNAESYLEKIIQVEFQVPEIENENIENMFFSTIKTILTEFEIEFKEDDLFFIWKYHGLKEFFRNIRDIKRYTNSIKFTLPHIKNNINPYDFIIIEAIKIFDYKSYEKIYSEYISVQRIAVWQSTNINTKIQSFDNETTKALLEYCFKDRNGNGFLNLSNAKRLKDPDFFHRYFTLNISSTDVSEESLRLFFRPGIDVSSLLTSILNGGRMENFLRRLADRELSKHYESNNIYLLESFLNFWGRKKEYITRDIEEKIWNAYFNLSHSYSDKYAAAQKAIGLLILDESETNDLKFLFNHFIVNFYKDGRSDNQLHGEIRVQIDYQFQILEKAFFQYLKKFSHSFFINIKFKNFPFISGLQLFSLAKFMKEEYIAILEKYINDSGFLSFLTKQFLMTDLETKMPSRLYLVHKDIYLPDSYFDKFIENLRDIKKGALDEPDELYVKSFLQLLRKENTNEL
jgi:GTPase SAR1 family protein